MRHCYCHKVCLAVLGKKEMVWGVEHTSTLATEQSYEKTWVQSIHRLPRQAYVKMLLAVQTYYRYAV